MKVLKNRKTLWTILTGGELSIGAPPNIIIVVIRFDPFFFRSQNLFEYPIERSMKEYSIDLTICAIVRREKKFQTKTDRYGISMGSRSSVIPRRKQSCDSGEQRCDIRECCDNSKETILERQSVEITRPITQTNSNKVVSIDVYGPSCPRLNTHIRSTIRSSTGCPKLICRPTLFGRWFISAVYAPV